MQSEEAASKAVTDAKKKLADAQEEIENLGDTATIVEVENALKNLVNAQKKLEKAEEVLANTKTILSKDEVEQLEGQIEGLKQELKKQAVDIENKIGDRISELEYELQQRMIEKDESEQQIKGINDQFVTKSIIDISSYPYEINLEKKSYPYTGKAIKPAVKVQGLSAQNYTVTYSNNTKIGTATVTVTAKGDKYTGKIQTTFEITKIGNTLDVKGKSVTLKYKKLKKTQRLKVAKVIKFNNKGQGTLTYTKVSGNKKITINQKTGKVTVKKGLKKGTYKVKVKVEAAGNDTYLASSGETVTFKVIIK